MAKWVEFRAVTSDGGGVAKRRKMAAKYSASPYYIYAWAALLID